MPYRGSMPRRPPSKFGRITSHVDELGNLVVEALLRDHPQWAVRATVRITGTPQVLDLTLAHMNSDDAWPHAFPRPRELRTGKWRKSAGDRLRTHHVDVPDAEPLSTAVLRSVSLPDLLAAVEAHLSSWQQDAATAPTRSEFRRRAAKDAQYRTAEIARRYVEALASGSHRPRVDVARALGLTVDQIRDALHEARRREYLTDADHGKAGGQLTELAKAILEAP